MRLANFWILPHNCSTLKSNSAVQKSPRKKLVSAPYLRYKIKELLKPRLIFFFKQLCFWFPVLPWKTSSSCFFYTFVHIHVSPGWKGNMTYTLIKVHFEDSRLQHSIVVTRLARESGGPNSILTPWKIKLFPFLFYCFYMSILMFKVYWACPLHKIQRFFAVFPKWIIKCWPTWFPYKIIDFICQNRFNFWELVGHLKPKINITSSLLRLSTSFFSGRSMNMIIGTISTINHLQLPSCIPTKNFSPTTDQLSENLGPLVQMGT